MTISIDGQYASKLGDVPPSEHWVIMSTGTHLEPGWDRAGPSDRRDHLSYQYFLSERAMTEELSARFSRSGFTQAVRVFHVIPMKVTPTVHLEVAKQIIKNT